jgi:hypothetical protein
VSFGQAIFDALPPNRCETAASETERLRGRSALVIAEVIRWDEKAGLRRDAVRSQVIDALEAQEIKETGNEED